MPRVFSAGEELLPEIDRANRKLVSSDTNRTLNWETGTMTAASAGQVTIDWDNSKLMSGIIATVSWGVGLNLYTLFSRDVRFTDATYDIGKSGSERPRDLFLSRNFVAGGTANITGAITNGSLTASCAVVSDGSKVLVSSATTATEIGYVNLVTGPIQAQIDLKAPLASPTFTGTVTLPILIDSGATINTAAVFNGTKTLISSVTTLAELAFVSGVTSAIQTQIDLKAPLASPTFTGTITTALTANRAVVTGAAGVLAAATTTDTQIGYLSGATGTTGTGKVVFDTAPTFATNITVTGVVKDTAGTPKTSIDTNTRILADANQFSAMDWSSRIVYQSDGSTNVWNWNTGTFSTAQVFSSTITNSTLTASCAVVSDGSKVLTSSATTATEIGYVNGVTSAIQTQINTANKLAYCAQKGYIRI